MSKKKKLFLVVLVLLIMFFTYNLIKCIRGGKQEIKLTSSSIYYGASNLNAMIEVSKIKDYDTIPIKAKVKIELLDKDEKKVKNTKKTSLVVEKNEQKNFEIDLPDNLEEGEYYLKATSKSGILKDVVKMPVTIMGNKNSDVVISLDKGIYKPGDEVNYRALLLSKKDNKPIEGEITVSIYDGNENRVYFENTKSSEYGIISGRFVLADEVNSGTYRLVVTNGSNDYTKSFTVNPYVTPKFEVNISSDKETYLVGEKASITVSAKYFFGEPVKQADVVLKIDDEEIKGITDEEGNYKTEYEIKDTSRKDFEVEVTDSSNYLIEAQKTIYGSTDKFEIELIPEYGTLVKGIDNNIYVVTKKASGEPIKTINKVSVGNIKRDVITDNSGMKSFTLTSSDLSKIDTGDFNIISTDSEGTEITKRINIELDKSRSLISTDKYKYNENDDIDITIFGGTEWTNKNLYICKGEELIKTVSIDSDNTTINLGDTTGLVDIYMKSDGTSSYYYRVYESNYENSDYIKKTIFIKPNKNLTVDISTDKEEYSPKDKLNLAFKTTNEDGNVVDSALLVSILDEAVLNLADNDLSIDNLKLALEDIELSDGVTAADLYAEVLEQSSDVKLQTMLLKQNTSNISIKSNTFNNEVEKEKNTQFAIISGIVLGIILIVLFVKKFGDGKSPIVNAIVGLIIIFAISLTITMGTFDIVQYFDFENLILMYFVFWIIIITILYIMKLNKYSNYLFRLILTLTVIPLIWMIILGFVYEILYEEIAIYMIAALVVIVWVILTIAKFEENLGKNADRIRRFIGSSIKSILFWVATTFLMEKTDSYFTFFVTITIYMLLDIYIFKNNSNEENDKKENLIQDGKIVIRVGDVIITCLIAFVIIVFCLFLMLEESVNGKKSHLDLEEPFYTSSPRSSNSSGGGLWSDIEGDINSFGDASESIESRYSAAADNTGTASRGTNIFGEISDGISSIFDRGTINDSMADMSEDDFSDIEYAVEESATTTQDKQKENNAESKVRNVFLESLAFIPEVVTENGTKDVTLDISDNITTWNIQVVGNTKEGRIGSTSKTFKVFKEFFVDFSLPTNSVIGDYIEIPVTIYNYTEGDLAVNLNAKEVDWAKIGDYEKTINVPAKSTNMIYIPLEILKNGQNTLRIESSAGSVTDIVEKTMKVNFNGLEKTVVESSGSIEKDFTQDIIFNENAIDGSKKIKVKLYPSSASEIVNGMENVLQMPTGCFEQTSSSLYPDILVLKYLEENDLSNTEIKEKAMEYISKGYQKLLTYEVPSEKGGYSLYGNSPAEPVITAFGLMEFKELSSVYEVDEKVINNMKNYLYNNQKVTGEFNYRSTYIGGSSSTDKFAMNAYITWALSEADPNDSRISKSVDYLEKNLDKITDNYTLALIANIFANTSNKKVNEVIDRLSKNINNEDNYTYLSSGIRDYYGTAGRYQNVQTTALTSIALSKLNKDNKANGELVNYIINTKDSYGTWGTTQSTILALKAINDFNKKGKIKEQTITVDVNGNKQSVDIKDDSLDIYEFVFDNISDENTVKIGFKDGNINYEVVKEYYQSYDSAKESNNSQNEKQDIVVTQELNNSLNINDIITQNIKITNNSDSIENVLVQINIPQGCIVDEDSLLEMKYEELIEKYEYNYGKINIYLRNFIKEETVDLQIKYRATYPERVTGSAIRVYDYYNPDIEGIGNPVGITVNK